MGDLVDGLAALDWIDRLDEAVGNIRNPEHVCFHFARGTAFTGRQVEQMLARYGVRIWGRGFTANSLFFTVKQRQARWTEYLLRRWGVPVLSQTVDPRNEQWAGQWPQGSLPPAWADAPRQPAQPAQKQAKQAQRRIQAGRKALGGR